MSDPVPRPDPDPRPRAASTGTGRKDASEDALLAGDAAQGDAILRSEHADPFLYLGPHRATWKGAEGRVVRACQPEAIEADLLPATGDPAPMEPLGGGLFAAWLPDGEAKDGEKDDARDAADYRLRFRFADGSSWERHDPYRFPPVLGDLDLYLIAEGTHLELWNALGARPKTLLGISGFAFAVWAPNARRVSVVGDFCAWDGRVFQMRRLGSSGVWEIFLPAVGAGEIYKYEIVSPEGLSLLKSDPLACHSQTPPDTASRTFVSSYEWGDEAWRKERARLDLRREPMAIYEVHLGSFARTFARRTGTEAGAEAELQKPTKDPGVDLPQESLPGYRELAPLLVEHLEELGFDHVEFLPLAEHPYEGSWGYQVTGYFAPTSRFGDPDDFRFLVDHLHRHGIGVIVDWVPAHFVKDAHGLGRFDGTALYEHEDPRRGEHPDWGTYIFNYGRNEVRNFLVSNALYWLEELHVDGLRVDAVASMLYLDYSREEGEWLPNEEGGNENWDARELLCEVNRLVDERCPGCFTVAEESTAWPKITHPVKDGGLGFDFKWNMGWMNDTLDYFEVDPYFRPHHHDRLTFAMVYEYSEAYVNPLSHDEVVHGKRSLWGKMPGDSWQKAANLRALFGYQYARPGKLLLFMGSELGSPREWAVDAGLDDYLLDDPERRGLRDFVKELGALYREHPALWRLDHEPSGFDWIACHDRDRSVFAFVRYAEAQTVELEAMDPETMESEEEAVEKEDVAIVRPAGVRGEHLLVILNLTPVPRDAYRLGAPQAGTYRVILSSDDERFGGSGYEREDEVEAEDVPRDGWRRSFEITLPPLSVLLLEPVSP